MMRPPSQRNRRRRAFTLIEVLLAISITGFVLASATTLIVSISTIWTNRQGSHFFADHVDGVTEFIQARFSEAGTEIALSGEPVPANQEPEDRDNDNSDPDIRVIVDNPNVEGPVQRDTSVGPHTSTSAAGLIRIVDNPIDWAKPPGFGFAKDPLINFRLNKVPPLLIHPEGAPTLGVDVFLYFKQNEGLSLLWYPLLQEEVEEERDLIRTQISPYVRELIYVYWDERFERWSEDTNPQQDDDDDFIRPSYIKLKFEHEGVTAERTVAIPSASTHALLF